MRTNWITPKLISMVRITIFTATYNREKELTNLYNSLVRQAYPNFEWLIVDDGSTDKTELLINRLILKGDIEIKYIKQPNSGKHIAMNKGVKEASGEIFFSVDSDDYLPDDSLQVVAKEWRNIQNDDTFAGIVGLRCFPDGRIIGGAMKKDYLNCNIYERSFKYKIRGDGADALRTKVLSAFPFPFIAGEKFCAESLIWNRIGKNYRLRCINKPIYIGTYLKDGLSANSIRNRIKSPTYACMLYSELANNTNIPIIEKIKAIINYWRFSFYKACSFRKKLNEIGFAWSILLIPFSYIYKIKDTLYKNVKIPK